jgi:hypothetical protein
MSLDEHVRVHNMCVHMLVQMRALTVCVCMRVSYVTSRVFAAACEIIWGRPVCICVCRTFAHLHICTFAHLHICTFAHRLCGVSAATQLRMLVGVSYAYCTHALRVLRELRVLRVLALLHPDPLLPCVRVLACKDVHARER